MYILLYFYHMEYSIFLLQNQLPKNIYICFQDLTVIKRAFSTIQCAIQSYVNFVDNFASIYTFVV
jgi:hypothetical protein